MLVALSAFLAGNIATGGWEVGDIGDHQNDDYVDYYHVNRCVIDDHHHIYIHALNNVLHDDDDGNSDDDIEDDDDDDDDDEDGDDYDDDIDDDYDDDDDKAGRWQRCASRRLLFCPILQPKCSSFKLFYSHHHHHQQHNHHHHQHQTFKLLKGLSTKYYYVSRRQPSAAVRRDC